MANKFGPIEIHCDAPSYAIVRACRMVGLETPEDVSWYRMSHAGNGPQGRRARSVLHWESFFGLGNPARTKCTCGQDLPKLERYTFTFLGGKEAHYFLGQCGRCRTVFWEEA
jgi:hypothetical protein